MNRRIPSYLAALLLAGTLTSVAQAQATRTFVASTGSDTNTATNCGRGAPCRNFAAAVGVTNAGGEVVALDIAGFGAVTVTKPITIESLGGGGALIAVGSNGTGITINETLSTDFVVLRGLTISGAGASNTTGVQLNTGRLMVVDCSLTSLSLGVGVLGMKADLMNSTFSGNTVAVKADGTGTDPQSFNSFGPTLVTFSGLNVINNGTAFLMANPGTRPCPQGFTCYPSCSIGSPSCVNIDNKVNIFGRLEDNAGSFFASNMVGNTTFTSGTGTGCTNPDPMGSPFCTAVQSYSGSGNPP